MGQQGHWERRFLHCLSVSFTLGCIAMQMPTQAQAYTSTLTASGAPVRWPERQVHFNLAGNPANQSEIGENDFFNSVVRGLQRWERASAGSVGFDYWQGKDRTTYSPASAFDGLSMIYFVSQAKADPHLSSNVLGLTQVWYDTSNGEILEADIALNDRYFLFTTNPHDTSGFGSGNSTFINGKSNVFIENVITHELGHAFGLSHSGGLQASMLFMESPEQAHLGCDDIAAIRSMYPSNANPPSGSITGSVLSENGTPVLGAHVIAISRRRGVVLASGLTDKSGRFKIDALEPGTYFLMVEPFYAGPQSLPNYYWDMKFDLCDNRRSFGRTVLTDGGGFKPEPVTVRESESTQAPQIIPRCRYDGGAAIMSNPSSNSLSSAPVLFNGLSQQNQDTGFGAIDQLGLYGANHYRLQGVQGRLEIHALSYSLYSPSRPILALYDSRNNLLSTRTFDKVYQGDSGYVNFDSALIADNLPEGDYYLKISGVPLDITLYPAGPVALDSNPFMLLTGTLNEGDPSASFPFNARCLMDENFRSYQSPPGDPPRLSGMGSRSTGFCATVSKAGKPPVRNRDDRDDQLNEGAEPAAIVSWFFPFLVMALFTGIIRNEANPERKLARLRKHLRPTAIVRKC